MLVGAVSKMEVTNEVKAQAKQFYHNILARNMRENFKEEAVIEGGNSFTGNFLIIYKIVS